MRGTPFGVAPYEISEIVLGVFHGLSLYARRDAVVAGIAKQLDVERKFLSRVFDGTEWYDRWPTTRRSTADREV
ncbi:hypothetical protein [Streptomyces violascens]|uniref:hypothetical protein n=1 Tax=Streptomyces violascens TaxID=67381 RepID=UPI0036B559C9